MPDSVSLDDAYAHCLRVAKRARTSFLPAMRLLPPEKRRSIIAVYAFSRECDDIADEDVAPDERLRRFAAQRQKLNDACAGRAQDPVGAALGDVIRRHAIPKDPFAQLIAGVESDGEVTRYATFEDLRVYCYRVASAVGLVCLEIFGYEDPQAREFAVDLGLGMQLTNILRDLREDAGRGRIYLPREDLKANGVSERDILDGVRSDAFRRLMAFEAARAREFLDRGAKVVPLVEEDARRCPALLRAVYATLLDRIEARQYDVYSRRVRLGTLEKAGLLIRAWAGKL